MDTLFDWAESAGSALDEKPRVLETKFGDGYSQRSPDGLNPIAQSWSLRFTGCDDAKANLIITFFREHLAVYAFDWAPLWATATIRVLCSEWSRSLPNEFGNSDITAKFTQVFEP